MATFPYRNAADFGFIPGRDADENSAALQTLLLKKHLQRNMH